MYRFSRAIYRELASEITEAEVPCGVAGNHERVLRSCEAAIERLATDRHYFARPARTLFSDIRIYFPMCSQHRVWTVVERYMAFADQYFQRQPMHGFDINGNPLECRATTRKGTPCQRMPLPHNGYCPSHQHLAETEEVEVPLAAEVERELQLAA
jgi:hypothetical protein